MVLGKSLGEGTTSTPGKNFGLLIFMRCQFAAFRAGKYYCLRFAKLLPTVVLLNKELFTVGVAVQTSTTSFGVILMS